MKVISERNGRSYVIYAARRPYLAGKFPGTSIQFAPKRLTSAEGGVCTPSRTLVCPQNAIRCFEGCHVTVDTGPAAGTRCIGIPVSTAHLRIESAGRKEYRPSGAHYVNIRARVGNSKILSVMREAQSIDCMTARDVRHRKGIARINHPLAASYGSCTYPFGHVKQIHDRIVSARRDIFPSGVLSYRNATSHVSGWIFLYR